MRRRNGSGLLVFVLTVALTVGGLYLFKNINQQQQEYPGISPPPQGGPTLPPGLNTTDINHYINKYGFDPPQSVQP